MALPRSLARDPAVTRFALPVGDAELAAIEVRPRTGATATALLLPGFAGSKEDFLPLLPLLAARGVRAVAVDLRGQFESPVATGPDGYTVPALAADVVAGITSLGDGPVHLLGHSFGGLVAQQVGRTAPELLTTLTLLCSGPGRLPPGARMDDANLLIATLPSVTLEQAWAIKVQREQEAGQAPDAEDVEAFLRTRWLTTSPESYVVMAQAMVDVDDPHAPLASLADALGSTPVLVARGQDDDAWTRDQQIEMAHRLQARFVELSDAAHSPAYEAPEATSDMLAEHWLAARPAPESASVRLQR